MGKKKRLDMFLNEEMKNELERIAKKQGRTITDLVREAIAKLIKEYKQ